jgi:cysteine-rich repeat protein
LNGNVCTPLYGGSCTYCNGLCQNITLNGGYCGDGVKQANEECDDGNTNNFDSCRNNCKVPYCGDGIKDKNEYCDDGNNLNGDGCSKTCRFECPNGVCTPNITIEKFPPQIWQCDNRVVLDDATRPGRISADGQTLVERINNYAFEGEQIQWKVLVLDKNGIEKVGDVYSTVDGNIESNCHLDHILTPNETIEPDCNAKIDEENLTTPGYENVAAYYTCTLTVETSDSMYGQSDINVEATDVDGEVGTMAEEESWFLNPVVSLGVEGSVNFSNLRPGTSAYSNPVILTNDADSGSGVVLDVFVSGTNFYDTSSSGAKCGTTNQLSLKQFSYFASNGAYSTSQDMQVGRTCDSEGYCGINYGIGFNNPNPFYNKNEVIQAQKVGPYYTANLLSPGSSMALTFRLNVPEPCNGNFNSGHIYFWGEAV